MNWVYTVVAFAGLIIFHEFGHFLFARLSGMKVERFAVGFGPALLKKQVGDTEYALCALPFGGYVKIAGMDPTEEGIEDDPRAYNNRPVWQRLLVIVAGPVFNYVLAAILFAAILMAGPLVADTAHAVIGDVGSDMPAAAAGLARGDKVVSVDGKPITDWKSFQDVVQPMAGKPVTLVVQRDDAAKTIKVTPKAETQDGKTVGIIGVVPMGKRGTPVAFGPAVVRGFTLTWDWNVRIVHALAGLFKANSGAQLQGPVAIIKRTSQAAERGIIPLLMLVAVISVHLGLFNLFPIPALDGGRLVFLGIEVVRRKPVNARIELAVHAVGFLLLIGLMLVITVGDVKRFFPGSKPGTPPAAAAAGQHAATKQGAAKPAGAAAPKAGAQGPATPPAGAGAPKPGAQKPAAPKTTGGR